MSRTLIISVFLIALAGTGCGEQEQPTRIRAIPQNAADIDIAGIESVEIEPGLSHRILLEGDGVAAEAGDWVSVQYTGWLYDENGDRFRGEQFDSSYDHGAAFRFRLGAGRVIQGWDRGVVGMRIGETRELTIAPQLGYGDRGAGADIPPGATLVFVVELEGIDGVEPASAASPAEN